jgi:exonuclease V gamma subunit
MATARATNQETPNAEEIKERVLAELEWDPQIRPTDISVTAPSMGY